MGPRPTQRDQNPRIFDRSVLLLRIQTDLKPCAEVFHRVLISGA